MSAWIMIAFIGGFVLARITERAPRRGHQPKRDFPRGEPPNQGSGGHRR
jgi:hypothetical protein